MTPFSRITAGYRPASCLLSAMCWFASRSSGISTRFNSRINSLVILSSFSRSGHSAVGPDEQHGTGCVFDYKARGGPQAPGPAVGTTLVACQDQQIHLLGGREHLALDAALARL